MNDEIEEQDSYVQWLRELYSTHNALSDLLIFITTLVMMIGESVIYYSQSGSPTSHLVCMITGSASLLLLINTFIMNGNFAMLLIKEHYGDTDEKKHKLTKNTLNALGVVTRILLSIQIIAFLVQTITV